MGFPSGTDSARSFRYSSPAICKIVSTEGSLRGLTRAGKAGNAVVSTHGSSLRCECRIYSRSARQIVCPRQSDYGRLSGASRPVLCFTRRTRSRRQAFESDQGRRLSFISREARSAGRYSCLTNVLGARSMRNHRLLRPTIAGESYAGPRAMAPRQLRGGRARSP